MYVASESEARVGGARRSFYCSRSLYAMSNSSVFKSRLKVLRSSADLQVYDSEFQTEGALTQNAFADNVSGIRGTVSNSLSADRRVCVGWYS